MIVPAPTIFLERGEAPLTAALNAADNAAGANEAEEISFWDLLDVVNPLQHIPVVSSIYRHLSGDEIGGLARLAGGFLFGGPIGLATSAANLSLELATGRDLGSHVINALDSEPDGSSDKTMLAASTRAATAYGEEGSGSVRTGSQVDFYDIDIPR